MNTSTPGTLYTPDRARRLATLNRALWTEMIRLVEQMIDIANEHDPDALAAQRMALRTLQIVLRGYSSEHRLWARLRQQGADRENDNSLFKFLDEVHEFLNSRLEDLDAEVAMIARGGFGPPEQHFGPGFCAALNTLRTVFADWESLSAHLDSIDSTQHITADEVEADDRTIAAIEVRARERREETTAAKKTYGRPIRRR